MLFDFWPNLNFLFEQEIKLGLTFSEHSCSNDTVILLSKNFDFHVPNSIVQRSQNFLFNIYLRLSL